MPFKVKHRLKLGIANVYRGPQRRIQGMHPPEKISTLIK